MVQQMTFMCLPEAARAASVSPDFLTKQIAIGKIIPDAVCLRGRGVPPMFLFVPSRLREIAQLIRTPNRRANACR